jgi:hypothetical protein
MNTMNIELPKCAMVADWPLILPQRLIINAGLKDAFNRLLHSKAIKPVSKKLMMMMIVRLGTIVHVLLT